MGMLVIHADVVKYILFWGHSKWLAKNTYNVFQHTVQQATTCQQKSIHFIVSILVNFFYLHITLSKLYTLSEWIYMLYYCQEPLMCWIGQVSCEQNLICFE